MPRIYIFPNTYGKVSVVTKSTNSPPNSGTNVNVNKKIMERNIHVIEEEEEASNLPLVPLGASLIKEKKKEMAELLQGGVKIRTIEAAMSKEYEFWNTQPVSKFNDYDVVVNEVIEEVKHSEVRLEPHTLPQGFKWDTLSLDHPQTLQELYQFLKENYVGDDYNKFRLDYSADFLLWALKPPGWYKEWHCGIRAEKSGKLLGFISAIPVTMRIYNNTQKGVEINFLCVHKKLRSKRVAPVLIREITRRVKVKGIFNLAVYTASVILPKPVSTCRGWHRLLNPKKLIDVEFFHLERNRTMQRTLKLYQLPKETKTPGFRVLEHKDMEQAHQLLNKVETIGAIFKYLSKFDLAPCFDEEDFHHWFLPRPDIVDCYVVENDGVITDLVSYYTLPWTVMNHPVHKSLNVAYSFYNVSSATPWCQLMGDALITVKNAGFDVFHALDLMENKTFLEPLKFGVGDCSLHYYLFNWRCPSMESQQVGLVLQ